MSARMAFAVSVTAMVTAICGGCGAKTAPVMADGGVAPVNHGSLIEKGTWYLSGWVGGDIIAHDDAYDLVAIPLAGGAPTTILANAGRNGIQSGVVYAFDDYDPTTGLGTLVAWTRALGAVPIDDIVMVSPVQVSADASTILYMQNPTGDRVSGVLKLARIGPNPSPVVVQASVSLDSCTPQFGAAGSRLFASYCVEGSSNPAIIAIDSASGASEMLLASAINTFSHSADGRRVLVAGDGGFGSVLQLGQSVGMPITTVGFLDGMVGFGYLSADGTSAVYRASHGLWRWSETDMSQMLVGSGVVSLGSRSPDLRHILYYTYANDYDQSVEMLLASTDTPGAPISLAMDGAETSPSGIAFTADSTRALYLTAVTADGAGTLRSLTYADSGPVVLGSGVMEALSLKGTNLWFNANWQPHEKSDGRADLKYGDAGTGNSQVIAEQAETFFIPGDAPNGVIYAWNAVSGLEGIYSATAP